MRNIRFTETNVKNSNVVSLTTKQLLDIVSLCIDATLQEKDPTVVEAGYSISNLEGEFLNIVNDDTYMNMANMLNRHIQAIRIGLKWKN